MDDLFLKIICLENLFQSWKEFKRGKRKKQDVQEFERKLENNLFRLHYELKNKTYRHSNYTSFYITDPKLRHVHKAVVRDRIVHHAIYRVLYPIFDKSFIYDSYSCRDGKGTHRAVKRFQLFSRRVSKNNHEVCFVLKCDVRKFFASIDHEILKGLIRSKVSDADTMWLINNIIDSFLTTDISLGLDPREGPALVQTRVKLRGTPIGNLTSQLFANIYLNELDRFVKNELKIKCYTRYCDDFVILDADERKLEEYKLRIRDFLESKLNLELHKDKVSIRRLAQGIDFLGYVVMSHNCVLRTKTKNRMLKRVGKKNLSSYLGLMKHCDGYKLTRQLLKKVNL